MMKHLHVMHVSPHLWRWMLLIAMLIGLQPACQRQPTKEDRATHHADEKDPHPAEEHEHFPPHWPDTVFRAANRLNELRAIEDSAKPAGVSLEREFVDLIRWLPELVADSDLSEQEFNRIDAWVSSYVDLLQKQQAGGSTLSQMLRTQGLSEKIDELVAVCRAESERRQALE